MSNTHSIDTDILIVGSGAGALAAAVTALNQGARVLVIEKSDQFGGTSAMSGGGIWIPNSENARKQGAEDSAEEAYTYMKSTIGDQVSDERIRAYVDAAPEMLDYLQSNSAMRYEAYPYPDYYSDIEGAKEGFRTQAPKVFGGSKLGNDLYKMRAQQRGALVQGRFTLTFKEARKFLTQEPGWRLTLLKLLLLYVLDIPGRLKSKRARRLTQGHSLIGSLYYSMLKKGGELWLNTALQSLIHSESDDGLSIVTGAVIERDGQNMTVNAKQAVILAAGGFEHNDEMRAQTLPQPSNADWSMSQENNTGDAIQAAQKIGAAVDLMQHAWWIPVVHVPGWDRPMGLFAERSLPGLVMVNQRGQRFTNEALPYLESGYALYQSKTVPCWVVFDADFRKKYPFGPLTPGWATPDKLLPKRVWDILIKANTLEELADKTGIDWAGLSETIERNKRFAASGVDEDFNRGGSFYDRYYGDARNTPNPCIADIVKPPFYALRLYPGDIGTKGGLLTNEHAQVITESGTKIKGLYAIGNTSSSVMGDKYLGAGATLGPAMTFGYLAALHANDKQPAFRSNPSSLSLKIGE